MTLLPLLGWGQRFVFNKYYDSDSTLIRESIEFRSRDSIPEGRYQAFFYSGIPKIQGRYLNGRPEGLWTYFFENGQKKSEGALKNGIAYGKWRYYYESGQLRATGPFQAGLKSGYWTNFYENGAEKSNGNYFNDQKEGIWNYFFEDSKLKAQAYFEGGQGNYKEFYPDGKVRSEGLNKDGKSEGQWKYYHENGQLSSEGNFLEGLRSGAWAFYHENGSLARQGEYTAGKKQGQWVYYHPNGQKSAEGDLQSDVRDGEWSLYYQTGEVKAKGSYDQGDGVYTEYYPNGKQKSKGKIINGLREGRWIYFDEEGTLDGEANYRMDSGSYKGYYEDQRIKMTGELLGEKRIGEWKLYDKKGNLAGVYRPIYEEEKPIFRLSPIRTGGREIAEKPEYVYKDKKSRYFTEVVNEYEGLIIGTNPLMTILNELPLALEYYKQERLGYEILAIYHREMFFENESELSLNETYSRGLSVRVRQKFYHPEGNIGMFYFGHQLGLTINNHHAESQDQTSLPFVNTDLTVRETLMYYGGVAGVRWMKNGQKPGLTIDAFVGFDIGLRNWQPKYDVSNEDFNEVFADFEQSSLFAPFRFGVHIGFTRRLKKIKNDR